MYNQLTPLPFKGQSINDRGRENKSDSDTGEGRICAIMSMQFITQFYVLECYK